MKRSVSLAIPFALAAAFALLPLALVQAYGVCSPSNEWGRLDQVLALREGSLSVLALLAHKAEHALLVPRLFLFGVDLASGFDNRWEMRASALLLALAIALCCVTRLGRKVRARDLWGFVPIALLLGNGRQLEGLLSGFELRTYLCLALSLGALAVLGEGERHRRALGCCGLGLLASACGAEGLALFPAALAQWWLSPEAPPGYSERQRFVPVLLASGLAAALAWQFFGVERETFGPRFSFGGGGGGFLALLGAPFSDGPFLAALEGALLFAFALGMLALLFSGRARMRRQALGPGLLVFGLLAAPLLIGTLGTTEGLVRSGALALLATLPAGLWITLLDLDRAPLSRDAVAALLLVAILGGASGGLREAFARGPQVRAAQRHDAWLSRTADFQPERTAPISREQAASLERLRWSLWKRELPAASLLPPEPSRTSIERINGNPPPAGSSASLPLGEDGLLDVRGHAFDERRRRAQVWLQLDARRLPAWLPDDRESAATGLFTARLDLRSLSPGPHALAFFARTSDGKGESPIGPSITLMLRPFP